MLIKQGNKYIIKLSNGHTEEFTSEEAAKKRLRAIEYFKHKNSK